MPRFFRISDEDLSDFPANTFGSIQLDRVDALDADSVEVEWRVWLGFYSSRYDWSLIFREIGEQKPVNASNMFYKTRHTLARHIEEDRRWAPGNETLLAR